MKRRLAWGPSATKGGWWLRVILTRVIVDGATGILFTGWGLDDGTPLRPWPTFGVEPRQHGAGVLSWVAWCGFFLAHQTARTPTPTGIEHGLMGELP